MTDLRGRQTDIDTAGCPAQGRQDSGVFLDLATGQENAGGWNGKREAGSTGSNLSGDYAFDCRQWPGVGSTLYAPPDIRRAKAWSIVSNGAWFMTTPFWRGHEGRARACRTP